jgi:hypothetical protein
MGFACKAALLHMKMPLGPSSRASNAAVSPLSSSRARSFRFSRTKRPKEYAAIDAPRTPATRASGSVTSTPSENVRPTRNWTAVGIRARS